MPDDIVYVYETELLELPGPQESVEVLVATDATVIELVEQGPPGPPGPAGPVGPAGNVSTYLAAQALGGHRVVRAAFDGSVRHASSALAADAMNVLGITTGAAMAGAPAQVQHAGLLVEPTWSWVPDLPVFLGLDGVLTQVPPVPPTHAFSLAIAIATSATSVHIDLKPPVIA